NRLRPICHGDDRRELRCSQLYARLLHAAGWNGSAGQHHDGRDHLRRCRFGHVRDADLRHRYSVYRGPDGWPNAGVPGQEGAGVRSTTVDALLADLSVCHPGVYGVVGTGAALRDVEHLEPRAAWVDADLVCVHVIGGQQWIGVRRAECEHALVQLDAGNHHADRPLPDDSADAGGGGKSCDQEDRADVGGHVSSEFNAVYGATDQRDFDRWRADVLSRAQSRTYSRTPAAESRVEFLAH